MPTEQDYKSAKKDDVKEILQFVFEESRIEDVRAHNNLKMAYTIIMTCFIKRLLC